MQAEENFPHATPLPQDQATSSLGTHAIQESPGSQPTLQNTSATSPKVRHLVPLLVNCVVLHHTQAVKCYHPQSYL